MGGGGLVSDSPCGDDYAVYRGTRGIRGRLVERRDCRSGRTVVSPRGFNCKAENELDNMIGSPNPCVDLPSEMVMSK